MLPVPVEADDNEVQGLMGSDDNDTSLTTTGATSADPSPSSMVMNPNNAAPTSQVTQPLAQNTDNKPRLSQRDVNKRIQSYLRESDENCRESATLVAIVVIGLIVTGSVIGFLQLGHHDPSTIHKGSHASVVHTDGEVLPSSLPLWLRNKTNVLDKEVESGNIDSEETLGIQPLYRNYVLQTIYEYSFQYAIRMDKNDPIFQHVSMTYGGPWNVPPPPAESETNGNQRRRMQQAENAESDIDSDSDTEKVIIDEESQIEVIAMENGRNDHTFKFGDDSNGYDDNVNQWHCYIFEFANADQLVTKQELWNDYTFKISAIFDNFEMESGHDFVRVYINSQYKHTFTGKLESAQQVTYRVDFSFLNQWREEDIPSFEICYNIITDNSVNGKGFDVTTKIEYENPEIVSWSGNNQCFVQTPTWRNPSRWDGSCGIGVATKKIAKCDANKLQHLEVNRVKPGTVLTSGDQQQKELEASGLYRGVCTVGEEQKSYCNLKDCGDAAVPMDSKEIKSNPKLKYHFNGHGRIDPTFPDPFTVQRSTNIAIDIGEMIKELKAMRDSIEKEYSDDENSDVRVLKNAVQQHSKMDDSRIRLGLKLARSLILGDTFHVVFTGSSNTAGHDNLFMSTYPMQLQSILRPLWKKIGYKGAAFQVSDRGVGGAIGTDALAWCIPEICGGNAEKIDVVFWESIMNDAGSEASMKHTMENHIRNALSMYGGTYNGNLANRPVWHAVIAGAQQNYPNSFEPGKGKPIYSGYKDLIEQYSDYGAGIIEFNPALGMNPMKASKPDVWSDEHFYVTWHPGPVGHRIYAEIIAYEYLNAVLTVLEDVHKTVVDLARDLNMTAIAHPVVEMLDLLQDAPYKAGLPPSGEAKKCGPACSDAVHSTCMLGFNPKDDVYEVSNFVVAANGWTYKNVAGNPQPISKLDGGQASIDTKFGFAGNRDSGQLVLSVHIAAHSNKLLLVEKPYADWGGLNDVLKKMDRWFTAEIVAVKQIDEEVEEGKAEQLIGTKLKCETRDKHLWMRDINTFGCLLKFEYAGKYHLALTVDTKEDIPICVLAAF